MYRYCPVCDTVHECRTYTRPLTENINGHTIPYQGLVYRCQFRKAPGAQNEFVSRPLASENHIRAVKVYVRMQPPPATKVEQNAERNAE